MEAQDMDISTANRELDRISAVIERTPRALELHRFAKGRFVAVCSAVASTQDFDGKVYEWTGAGFVRTGVLTPSARDRVIRKELWDSDRIAFHCPNWIALDRPVNGLLHSIRTMATKSCGGSQRQIRIRLMNMDILFMSILHDLACGKSGQDAAATVWPAIEKIVKWEGTTAHDLMAIQAELIARIED